MSKREEVVPRYKYVSLPYNVQGHEDEKFKERVQN
jgi:hypothetical protein